MSVYGEELKTLYREQYLNACKVIVAGGRDFENYEYMMEKLDELFLKSSIFKNQKIKKKQVWQKEQILLLFAMLMNVN